MNKEDFITYIEKMSVLELSELVKALEERFGVSASAPVMMNPAMPASGGEDAGGEKTEAKTTFIVEITNAGNQKIQVIKVLREVTSLGLKEAKDLVDAAPKAVKENASKEEAEDIKKKLEAAGATVVLK